MLTDCELSKSTMREGGEEGYRQRRPEEGLSIERRYSPPHSTAGLKSGTGIIFGCIFRAASAHGTLKIDERGELIKYQGAGRDSTPNTSVNLHPACRSQFVTVRLLSSAFYSRDVHLNAIVISLCLLCLLFLS